MPSAASSLKTSAIRVLVIALSVLLTAATLVGIGAAPSAAAADDVGLASIGKELDDVQGQGFTAPNTFQTGALVRYRIPFQCSSLTVPCNSGTIIDVLDPNLTFVEVIPPAQSNTVVTPSYDPATNTVTVNLSNFAEGTTSEIILIAKVKSSPANGGVIPNTAQIQVPGGDPVVSPRVDIVVPPATPNWQISKAKTSPTSVPAPDTVVTYHLEIATPTVYGNLVATTMTIVDSFPIGAVIDDPNGGVVDYTTHTITWTVGPLLPSVFQQWYANIKMHFPSTPRVPGEPAFSAGDIVVNNVDGHAVYADGSTGTIHDDATITLASPATEIAAKKTGQPTYVKGGLMRWVLTGTNTGNTTISNPMLTDTDLPSGVSNFYIAYTDSSILPTVNQIYEQLIDGVWQPLATYNTSVVFPWGPYYLDPAATGVRARPVTGVAVAGQIYSVMKLYGTVTGDVGDAFTNCAVASADGGAESAASCVNTTITEPSASLSISKTHTFADSGAATVTPGTSFLWNLAFAADETKGPVSRFTLTDTLPKGFTYQGLDCIGTYGNGGGQIAASRIPCAQLPKLANSQDLPAPTLTPNPDGSTRISWTIDLTDGHFGITTIPGASSIVVKMRVVVDPGTPVGSYLNTVAIQTDGPTTCINGTTGTDVNDNDGDGQTTETTCNATNPVDVAAAAIIDASKWDDGAEGLDHVTESTGAPSADCPDWDGYTRYPCVAQTTPGGPISYRFKLQNIGNVDATNYVMYDILPTTGDTGVSQLLSGQSRGTDWRPVMTGPLQLLTTPANAAPVVEYNLSSNPCRPELNQGGADGTWQASCDDTWYTAAQITDWTTVRSFRIKAFQPTAGNPTPGWDPLEEFNIQADLLAPVTAPTSTLDPLNLSIAWNSFAHREYRLNANGTTARLLASEPRKVGIIIPFVLPDVYAVGDYVWYDTDRDGIQDAAEKPVEGVVVTLLNADGSRATDANGVEIPTTTTDALGHYVFDNLLAGDYRVQFSELPTGFQTTTQNNAGNQTAGDDSNVPAQQTGTATTPTFSLGGGLPGMTPVEDSDGTTLAVAINRTIDAGLVQVLAVGDYVWYDDNHNGIQDEGEKPVVGMTVTLLNPDGSRAVDVLGAQVPAVPTDANGHYVFDNLPAGSYRVSFTGLPAGYVFTDQSSSGSTVANDSNPPASGLTPVFVLDENSAELRPVVPGDGTTKAGWINPTIDAGIVKAPVYAVGDYVWYDADRDGVQDATETPVPAVTVELLGVDGQVVATTATDADGHYVFDGLPPGSYQVRFSGLPVGFVTTTQNNAGNSTAADDSNVPAALSGTATTPVFVLGAAEAGMSPILPTDGVTQAVAINRTIDAGLVQVFAVGDYVWYDTNNNGIQDDGESPVPGVTVDLLDADGSVIATTTTDDAGHYVFDNLDGGIYQVRFSDLPTGFRTTGQNNAGNQTATDDSNVPAGLKGTATTPKFVIGADEAGMTPVELSDGVTNAGWINRTIDAGLVPVLAVGDYVWIDANKNGVQDAGETPVAGVTVTLFNADGTPAKDADGAPVTAVQTDAKGHYVFDNLLPGDYFVTFGSIPDGYDFTGTSVSGSTSATDSNPDQTGRTPVFTLAADADDMRSVESGDGVTVARLINPTIDAGLVLEEIEVVPTSAGPTETSTSTTSTTSTTATSTTSTSPTALPTVPPSKLSYTGVPVLTFVIYGAMLVLIGAGALLIGRRRPARLH